MILLAASLPSLALALAAGTAPQDPATASPGPLPREALQLPMTFVENAGQWDTPALFVASMGETLVCVEDGGFVVVTRADEEEQALPLRFDFVGASEDAQPAGAEQLPGLRNYFVGNDPQRWRSGVLGYAQVVYPELYEGVDLRLREADGLLEYDLHLAPGADLSSVVVRCDGTDSLEIDEQGGLLMETAQGVLRQTPPRTWCVLPSGEQQPLECEFVVHDATRFGFRLAEHDPDLPVVIDPGLEWATFLGGSLFDNLSTRRRAGGEIVVAGSTFSSDFPLENPIYGSLNGPTDCFVSVLDPTGSSLLWSTYFGGSGADFAFDAAVNAAGEVFIVGMTNSPDLPFTSTALLPSYVGGTWDGFVASLAADGQTLGYCSYLGGTVGDWVADIELREPRVVSLAGVTASSDFPVTAATAVQPTYGGAMDYFLCRMDLDLSAASQLQYSTFLGGSGSEGFGLTVLDDAVYLDLHLDAGDVMTLTGSSTSADFPTTPNAYSTVHHSGSGDVVVARIDPSQSGAKGLVYSTFIGGGDTEGGGAVVVDSGVITLGGFTYSSAFPTTPGAFQPTFGGSPGFNDAFVLRLDTNKPPADQLLYSTFLGGPHYEAVKSLELDSQGKITAQGFTRSGLFPTTCGAYQSIHGGPGMADFFIAYLDPAGGGVSDLLYSTFVGGGALDLPAKDSLAIVSEVPTLKVLTGGQSESSDFPTTLGAYQPNNAGGFDGVVLQLEINPHTYCAAAPNSAGRDGAIICGSGSVSIADNAFTLGIAGGPPNNVGLFVYGATAAKTPFGDGWLCLSSPVFRILPTFTLDPSGNASRPLDFTQPPFSSGPGAITPGSTWYFQLWYRDPAGGPAGYNLSNGLKATFYP